MLGHRQRSHTCWQALVRLSGMLLALKFLHMDFLLTKAQQASGKHRSATAIMVAGILLPHLWSNNDGHQLEVKGSAPEWIDKQLRD